MKRASSQPSPENQRRSASNSTNILSKCRPCHELRYIIDVIYLDILLNIRPRKDEPTRNS
jgi:hypothetical protein